MIMELETENVSNDLLIKAPALLYCRVSSKHQLKRGDGLASQEATCRDYAARKGFEVIEVFRDNVTGKVNDRPAMESMLKFLRKHRARNLTVIVDHPNRFSRDMYGHWDLRHLLKAAGGRLESPNMKFGESASDRLLENVMMSAAQYQREQNAEQTKDRMKGRLLNGYWPFIPPRAMRHQRVPGHGNILVRLEPEASVIAEGLQAFADGRLVSQAELARWLDAHPDFSKGKRKRITSQQASDLLTNFLYAGVVEKLDWGVTRRKGRHQGIISYETFERIQARLKSTGHGPVQTDLSRDFALRGSVLCGHCGKPLTACWSTSKTGQKHPYYLCYARGCPEKGKSIRRNKIEGELGLLLETLVPTRKLFELAHAMFRHAWDQRAAQLVSMTKSYDRQLAETDKLISKLLDRIIDASSPTLIGAFEKRLNELESTKLTLQEKRLRSGEKRGSFDQMFELAFHFLGSPQNLWHSGVLEQRKMVLRLAFSEPLSYARNEGFRTPKTTMPFSMLGDIQRPFDGLAVDVVCCEPVSDTRCPAGAEGRSIVLPIK